MDSHFELRLGNAEMSADVDLNPVVASTGPAPPPRQTAIDIDFKEKAGGKFLTIQRTQKSVIEGLEHAWMAFNEIDVKTNC